MGVGLVAGGPTRWGGGFMPGHRRRMSACRKQDAEQFRLLGGQDLELVSRSVSLP